MLHFCIRMICLKKRPSRFFFKLFRFGSIMITPTILYVGYTIFQEDLSNELKKKWRFFLNHTTVLLFYGLAFLVYISGWSDKGISDIELLQIGSTLFYFPVYGELSWIFKINVLLFIVCMITCFLISLQVQDKNLRSFLVYFNIITSFAYAIGSLNMFPSTRLFPSSIAILVFAISPINSFEPNVSRNCKQYE